MTAERKTAQCWGSPLAHSSLPHSKQSSNLSGTHMSARTSSMSDNPKYRSYPFHRPLQSGEFNRLMTALSRPFPLEGWSLRYRVHDKQDCFQGKNYRLELEFMMQDAAHPIVRLFFTTSNQNPDWELFVINEGEYSVPSNSAAASLANKLLDEMFRAAKTTLKQGSLSLGTQSPRSEA